MFCIISLFGVSIYRIWFSSTKDMRTFGGKHKCAGILSMSGNNRDIMKGQNNVLQTSSWSSLRSNTLSYTWSYTSWKKSNIDFIICISCLLNAKLYPYLVLLPYVSGECSVHDPLDMCGCNIVWLGHFSDCSHLQSFHWWGGSSGNHAISWNQYTLACFLCFVSIRVLSVHIHIVDWFSIFDLFVCFCMRWRVGVLQ